jgi:uroporphyrin-III C-methyltransferase/precorrin-2 dehydrogenase/sirohydrochlorin ferrochelatase
MDYYPIFIDLKNQDCLIVGGGQVALRKARLLVQAGAKITIIAPVLDPQITQELGTNVNHLPRTFLADDIAGYRIVIAATNHTDVNALVSQCAHKANIPVNVVDDPALCSFITPAIIDRSPITIAISTAGKAPIVASAIRAKLEAIIPKGYGRLASAISRHKCEIKQRFPDQKKRTHFLQRILQTPEVEKLQTNDQGHADQIVKKALSSPTAQEVGQVWLIGAGPGDPDLLTFRALRLMQQADVVLHDRLVSGEILNLTRRDAHRIYVGKRRSEHSVPQNQINQRLVDLALEGNNVVRLKGGDPFIFGRGGEEIELLKEAGIPFQVIPGITAASGCASYAGIPLTHRDHAQSCLFVTGHLKDGSVNLNWQNLAAKNQTVVVYMGLLGVPTICKQLIAHGVVKTMPIALIERGTTSQQQVHIATLESMEKYMQTTEIQAPTLLIIGTVVSLRDQLDWLYQDD